MPLQVIRKNKIRENPLKSEHFHFELERCDLFEAGLVSYVFLNIVMAVYFERSTPGRVITMASFCQSVMANVACRIVSLSSWVSLFPPSFCLLSDVRVSIFTSLDKSIIFSSDSAWKQLLKMDTATLKIGQTGTKLQIAVELLQQSNTSSQLFITFTV